MVYGTFVAYYISMALLIGKQTIALWLMDRLLVVDDNRDLGRLTSEVLTERGFRVHIAFDGESALAKVKKHPFDLMLLDYKLPGITGITVLEKSRQIRPNLKTIMISAFGSNSTRARAKELGAYAFLDKPFDIDGLVKVIRKALTEQRGRCTNEANLRKLHSRCSPDEHLSSSGFCSGTNSGSPKDRHPFHIGAG